MEAPFSWFTGCTPTIRSLFLSVMFNFAADEGPLFYQVVELDFFYPSEGIHRRWESGYRITSTAATNDQAALILSIPKCKPQDETQETLRTSQFPSTHLKVNTGVIENLGQMV